MQIARFDRRSNPIFPDDFCFLAAGFFVFTQDIYAFGFSQVTSFKILVQDFCLLCKIPTYIIKFYGGYLQILI